LWPSDGLPGAGGGQVWVWCPNSPFASGRTRSRTNSGATSGDDGKTREGAESDDDGESDADGAAGELSADADADEAEQDAAEEAEAYADARRDATGGQSEGASRQGYSSSGGGGGEYLRWWERGGVGGPFGGSSPLGGGWDRRLAWWCMVGLARLDVAHRDGGGGDASGSLAVAAELGEDLAAGLARNVGRLAKAAALSYSASAKGVAKLQDRAEKTMADPKVLVRYFLK
jgi:hypothetical protein